MSRIESRIELATVNVRYDGLRDLPVPIPPHGAVPPAKRSRWGDVYGELPWAERRSRLVDALLATGSLDVVGFQEVYKSQLLDLSALLGASFAHVGVGRDDGREAGEYSPIFYNSDKFEVVRWKTIWLSPTPEVAGSIGWDASQTRIATLLTLSWLYGPNAGKLLHVVNTHYDDQGVRARAESSLLIREQIYKWIQRFNQDFDEGSPDTGCLVLLGDFNSPPSEDGYKFITSPHPLPSGTPSASFLDSYTNLSCRYPGTKSPCQSRPYGPEHTYTGFTKPGRTSTQRIDFVMLGTITKTHDEGDTTSEQRFKPRRSMGGWRAVQYACIDNRVEEGDADGWTGRWSDHRAVRVTIERS